MNELRGEIGESCYNAIYDGNIQAEHIVPAIRVSILEKIWKDLASISPIVPQFIFVLVAYP